MRWQGDLLVVGGGPAGAAAAITAAQAGLTVAVLERSVFPRERPGETLHPGVEPLFKQLGVIDRITSLNLLRPTGYRVRWGTQPERFVAFGEDAQGPWRGFQAPRTLLDTLLLEQAKRLGVALFQPIRARRPLVEGERVVGVETDQGVFRATFVIDATGKHWLAQHQDLPLVHYGERRIVRYGYRTGEDMFSEEQPLLVGKAQGWYWEAKIAPERSAWVELQRGNTVSVRPMGCRSMDMTWRHVETSAGAGYFLTGDAAIQLDPGSGHGVLRALMTGMMAAHRSWQIVAQELTEEEAVADYRSWLHAWFLHDCQHLEHLETRYNATSNETAGEEPC